MEGLWLPWIGVLWTLAMLGASNWARQDIGLRNLKMLYFRAAFMTNPLSAASDLCRNEKAALPQATLLPACFIQVTVQEGGVEKDICQGTLGRPGETLLGPRWYVIQWVCIERTGSTFTQIPQLSFRIKR
jgi:hypothetical protein